MKKMVLIYGFLASLIVVGVSSLFLWSSAPDSSLSHSEWLGYLTMVLGLSVIFVAVKQHRDHNLGGVIGFKSALLVGLLVTLITTVCYVLAWEIFFQQLGQSYLAEFTQQYLLELEQGGASPDELAATRQEMSEFGALYNRFYFRMFITALEILPVGLVISFLCAALLRTRSTG